MSGILTMRMTSKLQTWSRSVLVYFTRYVLHWFSKRNTYAGKRCSRDNSRGIFHCEDWANRTCSIQTGISSGLWTCWPSLLLRCNVRWTLCSRDQAQGAKHSWLDQNKERAQNQPRAGWIRRMGRECDCWVFVTSYWLESIRLYQPGECRNTFKRTMLSISMTNKICFTTQRQSSGVSESRPVYEKTTCECKILVPHLKVRASDRFTEKSCWFMYLIPGTTRSWEFECE